MLGESVPFVGNFITITYHQNTGAAFGLFVGRTPALSLVSVLFIFLTVIYLLKSPKQSFRLPLALVLGGAVGNLIDRLRYGFVIDFIDVKFWPIFNLADSAITCGVLLMLARILARPPRSKESAV